MLRAMCNCNAILYLVSPMSVPPAERRAKRMSGKKQTGMGASEHHSSLAQLLLQPGSAVAIAIDMKNNIIDATVLVALSIDSGCNWQAS